jgi:hypothetical protein
MGFYDQVSVNTSLFDQVDPDNLDLRAELHSILYNENRGTSILYRRMQTENQIPKRCICWNQRTQEPDIDIQCKYCRGTGYFFNDYLVVGFKSHSQGYATNRGYEDPGIKHNLFRTFYFEHDFLSLQSGNNLDIPTTYDKIIEVETDIDGIVSSPLRQLIKYDILSVDSYRLESNGRIEYYRIRSKASPEGSYLI